MGGIIRCIKNEYSLDQIENEINKTDNESGFDEIMEKIKENNNAYIDIDNSRSIENNHYKDNYLEKYESKRSNTFSIDTRTSVKLKI